MLDVWSQLVKVRATANTRARFADNRREARGATWCLMRDACEGLSRDGDSGQPPPWPDVPADFVLLAEPLPAGVDRGLGYVGERRFVAFRYETRAEEVMWDDGHTYGFGAGGWCIFLDRIAPLAARYGTDVGLGGAGSCRADVLVLDRATGSVYFASRASADQFLARVVETLA